MCVPEGDLNLASGTPRASPWMLAWWQSERPLCEAGGGSTSRMCGITVICFSHPLPAHVADLVVVKEIIFVAPAMCHISHMCI